MKEFVVDGRRVVEEAVDVPNSLVTPFGGEVYVAVLWACDDSFDESARLAIATALLQSGCRYIVCGGLNCEAWHDDADLAWVSIDLDRPSSEISNVMTSWHTGESQEDVISFAFTLTNFGEHVFRNYLVVVLGHDPLPRARMEELIQFKFGR